MDFIHQATQADGIISTRQPFIRRAKDLHMHTILRVFVLDSIALSSLERLENVHPDFVEVLPGTLACVGIAVVATIIGRLVPLVGAAVPAIVLGIVIAVVRKPSANLVPGIGYSSKFVLQCAVVLLGLWVYARIAGQKGLEELI